MKIAIQTATYSKDYEWYSADSSFKSIAEQQWLNWHNEVYDGTWFGLLKQNEQTFFLAGKIPTQRQDLKSRPIVNYVVMQPETDNESKQLAALTADLLSYRQDISDISNQFVKWTDAVCTPMAEQGEYNYSSFPVVETASSISETSIGRYEYPLTSRSDRLNIAGALSAIVEKREDFLVGCIQYPVERFIAKVCKDLSPNAQLAVFSAKSTSKKEIMGKDPFSTKKPFSTSTSSHQGNGTHLNKALKALCNPLTIGLTVFVILFATFCHLWHQNAKKASQIQDLASQVLNLSNQNQDLASQVQSLTTLNQDLTNQIANKETTLKGYLDEIQKKAADIQKWKEEYSHLQENSKNTFTAMNQKIQETIQRYEADLKEKDAVIEGLKKQINQLQLPSPTATPAQNSGSSVE